MKNSQNVDLKKQASMEGIQPPSREDSIDLSALRLTQDFHELVAVKKKLVTVPVRKPNGQQYVRVRPGDEWWFQTYILELKEEREHYLIHQSLWGVLQEEITPRALFLAVNRQGNAFLWPVRLPDQSGRLDSWNQSALEAVEIARVQWVRVRSNRDLGAYDVIPAIGEIADPAWPEESFDDILRIAFKDRFIQDIDHPVIRQLRGLR